jgi:hypothetical protein
MKVLAPNISAIYSATVSAPVGALVTLSAFVFEVIDQNGLVKQVSAAGTVTSAAAPFGIQMNLDAATNTLAVGETRAIRQIRVTMTFSDTSVYTATINYIVRSDGLIVGENSFMNELEAELLATDMHDLAGWSAATSENRRTALISAYEAICRMQFIYDEDTANQSTITWDGDTPGSESDLDELDAAKLALLPPEFFESLKKAQLYQANYVLGGEPEQQAIESGVFSRTVGESSQMFRPGMKPIEFPVCKRAMKALHGYTTVARWRIGRG